VKNDDERDDHETQHESREPWGMPESTMIWVIVAMNRAPIAERIGEPSPPVTAVPPTSTAATTSIVRLGRLSACTWCICAACSTAAMPIPRENATNAQMVVIRGEMPLLRAVSRFAPSRCTLRPIRVYSVRNQASAVNPMNT
jgi:hypothetical protein